MDGDVLVRGVGCFAVLFGCETLLLHCEVTL